MREAVVVASSRTPLAKSFRGSFNMTRPDDRGRKYGSAAAQMCVQSETHTHLAYTSMCAMCMCEMYVARAAARGTSGLGSARAVPSRATVLTDPSQSHTYTSHIHVYVYERYVCVRCVERQNVHEHFRRSTISHIHHTYRQHHTIDYFTWLYARMHTSPMHTHTHTHTIRSFTELRAKWRNKRVKAERAVAREQKKAA